MMIKTQGWEQRLADYLRDVHIGKVSLSHYDCAMFAARWVEIACNIQIKHSMLRSGLTREESLRLLNERSLIEWVSEVLSNAIPILQAMRGDIVLRRQAGLEALGICDGEGSQFLSSESGLIVVPTLSCDLAWSLT